MKQKKRFRMTFRTETYKRKILYTSCTEDELQGEKERLAAFLEAETGRVWHCTDVTEVNAETFYVGRRKGGAD